jgi:N-acylglucosamine 2-epimerase|eukprot:g7538.t1
MADTPESPRYWLNKLRGELYSEVLPWWIKHSLDEENGGYYNCIHEDGSLFDFGKYVWLQGRQVWMLAKIYGAESVDDTFLREHASGVLSKTKVLNSALLGARFLQKHAVRKEDGQVWFLLGKDGSPVQMQRKPWGACFYCMGLAELARVMPNSQQEEAGVFYRLATDLFRLILTWFETPWLLGSKYGKGQPATSSLAVPMILLNMCNEIRGMVGDPDENDAAPLRLLSGDEDVALLDICNQKERWCIKEIKKHIKYTDDGKSILRVLETVGAEDGEELEGSAGRVINPGHVIEAGWFLMQFSQRIVRDEAWKEETLTLGRDIACWALDYGWDKEHGGIFYFLDCSEKYSPMELEWDMKLWWPHTEALIAFCMGYYITRDEKLWDRFVMVAKYTIEHFKDNDRGGEWYGYCNRQGEVTQTFKGGPYKGCFHVPRALFMCVNMLDEMCNKEAGV